MLYLQGLGIDLVHLSSWGIVSVGPLKTEIVLLSFIFIPYKGYRMEDIQSNEKGMRLDNAHSF